MRNFRLIQISDCHLLQNTSALFRQQPVYANLQGVIASAQKQSADALLLTGDLAQDEQAETYQLLPSLFGEWPSPIYWVPGNHDDLSLMQQYLIGASWQAEKQLSLGNWHVVLLNSQLPYDSGEGCINEGQLDFLQQQLRSHKDKFVLVVLHHHVLPINGYMDKYNLQNASVFLAELLAHKNVKLVLSGHVHQAFDHVEQGVRFLTSPSTCYQIKPGTDKCQVDVLQPGYRVIDLFEDGHVETEVIRV